MRNPSQYALPLIRYYALGSARLAQRNALVSFSLVVISFLIAPEANDEFRAIALAVTAAGAPRGPALLVAIVAVVVCRQSMPTLRLGLAGWTRSLPIPPAELRRAFALGLVVPLAPLVLLELVSAALATTLYGRVLAVPPILGFAAGMLAAGAAATPTRAPLGKPVALTAAFVWTLGTWPAVAASALLLVIWDLLAGPVTAVSRPHERTHLADRWLGSVIALRALGLRSLQPLALGVAFLGAAWLFRVNNGLSVADSSLAARLATTSAILLGQVGVAEALLARRRPWPWLRSLPISSRRRVLEDAVAIALPVLPTLFLAALLDRLTALIGLATLPFFSLLAVFAIRRAHGKLFGVGAQLLGIGSVSVALLTIHPATALLAIALAPVVLFLAARSDRAWIVTGWDPLHHDSIGDSMGEVTR